MFECGHFQDVFQYPAWPSQFSDKLRSGRILILDPHHPWFENTSHWCRSLFGRAPKTLKGQKKSNSIFKLFCDFQGLFILLLKFHSLKRIVFMASKMILETFSCFEKTSTYVTFEWIGLNMNTFNVSFNILLFVARFLTHPTIKCFEFCLKTGLRNIIV